MDEFFSQWKRMKFLYTLKLTVKYINNEIYLIES